MTFPIRRPLLTLLAIQLLASASLDAQRPGRADRTAREDSLAVALRHDFLITASARGSRPVFRLGRAWRAPSESGKRAVLGTIAGAAIGATAGALVGNRIARGLCDLPHCSTARGTITGAAAGGAMGAGIGWLLTVQF